MRREETHLDGLLMAWCAAFKQVIDETIAPGSIPERNRRSPVLDVAVSDRAVRLVLTDPGSVGISFDTEILKVAEFDDFVAGLRACMPSVAWPVRVRIELENFGGSNWWRPNPVAMGVAGKLFGTFSERTNDMVTPIREWSSFGGVRGLDRLAAGMSLIDIACPPSNRPVGAWSTGSNIIGTEHLSVEDVYARTEVEVVLKRSLFRRGLQSFRKMIEGGRFEPQRNDERTWFVVAELEGLDDDPIGSKRRFPGVVDDINDRLSLVRNEDFEP
ncbi:hypothetical protein KUV57_11445 [Epibacterium sp. DP7N7-1]|nr:hypothetical protein [Epibacterium sp. DP7N7-1]